ncbi:hypothetical protein EV361DRAFT_970346 [Lentinula raphanica]|nr:hypothetical protein EV361DRAFT_970346 [Lentinula raphanica]
MSSCLRLSDEIYEPFALDFLFWFSVYLSSPFEALGVDKDRAQTPFEFLHVVSSSLPTAMSKDLATLCTSPSSEALLDNLIRFVCGADCSSSSSSETQWASHQALVRQKLGELLSSSSNFSLKKRPRDGEGQEDGTDSTKKQKLSPTSYAGAEINGVDFDPPKFTLQSISVTSPIRKKVDIAIHQFSVRFINSSTKATEAFLPLSSLKRAFLLPTRGKPKPHWTVIILSNDTGPEKKGKGKNTSSTSGGVDAATEQIIFGLDATATTVINTISHSPDADQSTSLQKGGETLDTLTEFLSQLSRACEALPRPNPLTALHLSIEKIETFKSFAGSSTSGGNTTTTGVVLSPSLAISANLAAKPGTLWLMPTGILWSESKPCMFWSVEDLAKEEDVEGVRTISATGRVCTVVLTRKVAAGSGAQGDGDLEETGFGQVEGKEQETINQWVRKYRHLFGSREPDEPEDTNTRAKNPPRRTNNQTQFSNLAGPSSSSLSQTQNQGPLTINQMMMDSDDEDDASFEPGKHVNSDSESDDDDDEDEESDEDSDGEQEGKGVDSGGEGEASDEESMDEDETELDPAHHPLLRPGAMPKMSRAAVDMVVGMVEEDMLGADEDEDDELDD